MVKICEVVDGCGDCPKYGDDCDGDKMTEHTDYISRADAMGAVHEYYQKRFTEDSKWDADAKMFVLEDKTIAKDNMEICNIINALPSADAINGWENGRPTEQGKYIVTLDSFGHRYINLLYYGKPMMPNRKVRGKCWYRSDDEWGDVVYDDTDILAWQPLPKPYKGGDDE